MKRKFENRLEQSLHCLLSIIILLFIITLYSCEELKDSYDLGTSMTEQLEDGSYKESTSFGNYRTIQTGPRDDHGRFHGPVEIKKQEYSGSYQTIETVNMNHGMKEGTATIDRYLDGKWLPQKEMCYVIIDGRSLSREGPCENSPAQLKTSEVSAYQILEQKYFNHIIDLNISGFDEEYIMKYLDTLEQVIESYEFEEADFYDYYDEAVEALSETPFDSIIVANEDLTMINTYNSSKNSVFRLAVVDSYTSDQNTFDVFQTTYPGYIEYLNENAISTDDFEIYLEKFDSLMVTYEPMSKDDPLYIDSLTWRMSMAVITLGESEDKTLKTLALTSRKISPKLRSLTHTIHPKAGLADISTYIILSVFQHIYDSDPISLSVWESWMMKQGIAMLPTVSAVYLESNTFEGIVLEDGGADITERGIAWATVYNPTTENNTETSGTGTGNFTITLEGLAEETPYYVRSYAINSAGTAYSSCIEFVAHKTTGLVNPTDIGEERTFINEFILHPNPANTYVTISFTLQSNDNLTFTILNIKGQEVYKLDMGLVLKGEQQIPVDLSEFSDGTYVCIISNGNETITEKLVIAK